MGCPRASGRARTRHDVSGVRGARTDPLPGSAAGPGRAATGCPAGPIGCGCPCAAAATQCAAGRGSASPGAGAVASSAVASRAPIGRCACALSADHEPARARHAAAARPTDDGAACSEAALGRRAAGGARALDRPHRRRATALAAARAAGVWPRAAGRSPRRACSRPRRPRPREPRVLSLSVPRALVPERKSAPRHSGNWHPKPRT